MTENAAPEALLEALDEYNIDLPEDQTGALARYCQVLWQWNEKLNLTRHTDYDRFVSRDLIDSLQLERQIQSGDRVLDVGTGGGVPGVILAILRPDLQVSLCDSVAKRARAVADIVEQLNLDITVLHAAAQAVLAEYQFETLVARAVAPLPKLLTWLAPHWAAFSQLLIVQGPRWIEQRGQARHVGLLTDLELRKVAEYTTPGNDHPSVILRIRPEGD
jgi:16S rRNA (guanine527-N7)-methyltransferase